MRKCDKCKQDKPNEDFVTFVKVCQSCVVDAKLSGTLNELFDLDNVLYMQNKTFWNFARNITLPNNEDN